MGLDHLFALRPGLTRPILSFAHLKPRLPHPISLSYPTNPHPPQNRDPAPPVLRRHSSSDISKQKFGTMPLVPIRGDESNSSMLSANQTLVSNCHKLLNRSMKYLTSVTQSVCVLLFTAEEAARPADPLNVLCEYCPCCCPLLVILLLLGPGG